MPPGKQGRTRGPRAGGPMIAKRRLRLLTVVGARPQFVKAAVVSRAIAAWNRQLDRPPCVEEEILHTGQHYDPMMSQVFFDEMDIPPPVVNLQVGSYGGHGAATAAMLTGIEQGNPRPRARLPAGLRRHQLDAGRRPGRGQAPRSRHPRGSGPAVVATAACPRKSTASWSITWPACSSARRSRPARTSPARASPPGSTWSAT